MADNMDKTQKCYSCHKICESNNTQTLNCNHIVCKKCLSISFINTEFKNISYETITLTCFCGIGKHSMAINEAKLFFFDLKNESKIKKCSVHKKIPECYCETCQMWLCSICKTSFHNDLMSDHKIFTKPQQKFNECQLHHIRAKAYCNQCESELCLECIDNDKAHSSFHINIIEKTKLIKDDILARVPTKNNEDIYHLIDIAEEEYNSKSTSTYNSTLDKIKSIIKSLTATIDHLQKLYNKEKNYSHFILNLMRYSYNNYFNAIEPECPTYVLLNNISTIKTGLIDISIESKHTNEIDKMLFDIKKLNKSQSVKLNIKYKSFIEDNLQKDNQHQALTFKTCHSEFMSAMCVIDDGIYCTGALDNVIKVFKLNREENSLVFKKEFNEHKAGIKLLLNVDYGKVVSVSNDNVIIIWQIGSELKSLVTINSAFIEEIFDIAIYNNNHFIVSGDRNVLKVINIGNGSIDKEIIDDSITNNNHSIRKLLWIPNSKSLITGADDGSLSLWNEEKKKKRIIGDQSPIYSLIQISDILIASGSAGNSIRIFSLTDLNCLFKLESPQLSWITSLCYISNKNLLVSGSKDNTIVLWDSSVTPYKYIKTFTGHKNTILFLSVTEQINLVSGSCDTLIKLWKLFD